MVRFFGKTKASSKEAAALGNGAKSEVGAKPATPPPGPPARTSTAATKTATKTATTAAAAEPAAKKTVRRRTTAARPPRKDWAAEAAAAPVDGPSPKASSLASAPASTLDETEAAAPATKRRRGTRGGRGRKKPGTALAIAETTLPSIVELGRDGEPPTIEAIVAHQAAVMESFAREVSTTLKTLTTAITDLQSKAEHPASTSHPRVGIFVDVPNLIYAAERRNINLDFMRILDFFTRGRDLVRATAYAPISDDPQAKLESQRFVHYFVGLPYRIVTKPLKRFNDGSMKANFDIELAVDVLTMSDRLDIVVLMSGDGDFRRVVELIASRGVRVEVVAFAEAASSELKSVADLYVDVGAHLDEFKVQK